MGGLVGRNLAPLGPVTVCLGLKNSDDIGTYFDLRVDLLKNGVTIATGETKGIGGITRNPCLSKEVTVTFGSTSDNQLNSGNVLSLRILTNEQLHEATRMQWVTTILRCGQLAIAVRHGDRPGVWSPPLRIRKIGIHLKS